MFRRRIDNAKKMFFKAFSNAEQMTFESTFYEQDG